MKIGDYVYQIYNEEKIFGEITDIIDQNYLLIQFQNKSHPTSVHKDNLGTTYFPVDKITTSDSATHISKNKIHQTIKEEEWSCAKQIIDMYDQKIYELNQMFYQRDHHYELVAFETETSIKQKLEKCHNILNNPFKYHLYYISNDKKIDVRLGTYPLQIEGSNLSVQSLNSTFYGELLMKNRLGETEMTIDNQTYHIEKRRDIHFKNRKISKINEIKFDDFMKKVSSTNLDKYLIDTLSKDELYQTRLKTNSQELQDIFWSMSATQFDIIRENVDTPLIVQGGAGTGKTSIGIHRLAYLFYNKLITQGIILGPNEAFANLVKDSIQNMGIDSNYDIQIFYRLDFYQNYFKEIQLNLSNRIYKLNSFLLHQKLNPILPPQAFCNNTAWTLNKVSKKVEILTKQLYEFISWDELLKPINQIESMLLLKKTTKIQSLDDVFTALEPLLKELDTHCEYHQLKEKIHQNETYLQTLIDDNDKIEKKIQSLGNEYHKFKLDLDLITDDYQQSEAHFTPIKEKYLHYTTQLKQFQLTHNELYNRLNTPFSTGLKKQYELSTQLIDVTTTLVSVLRETYHVEKQQFEKLSEKVNTLKTKLSLINDDLDRSKNDKNKVQTEIIRLKESLKNDEEELESFKFDKDIKKLPISEVQKLLTEVIDKINYLNPFSFFTSQSQPLDQNNILLWLHFYFTLFPKTKEKYANTYFFIDEAQDLSLFELHLFHQINSKFVTIVGDINQNIFGYHNLVNWDDPCSFYHAKFYELQYNWRSTKQLVKAAKPYIINYDYQNIGVVSGYPHHQKKINSLEELTQFLTEDWLLEKINNLPKGKSCAIIALDKTQLSFLKLLLKPLIKLNQNKDKLIDFFDGHRSIQPNRIILTSIDYVKGFEFFSTIIPIPYTDDFDQFQKARVYTALTRATDDLTIFLIEE